MKTILRTFAPLCLAALTGCGGGGGGAPAATNDLAPLPAPEPAPPVVAPAPAPPPVAAPEPEPAPAPPAANPAPEPPPVAAPAPEPAPPAAPEPEPVPAAAPAPVPVAAPEPLPEPLPEPATLLQSHDRLSLPDGFNAVLADEAMFLLANTPYREAPGGGSAGLAVASLALQAGALALYTAERSAEYTPDHAVIDGPWVEHVDRVKPEVTTRIRHGAHLFYEGGQRSECFNSREECRILHPDPALRGSPWDPSDSGAIYARAPIADMPFVSNAMRERSEGVRSRGGVDLRYWSSGNREVPWMRYRNRQSADSYATETWSGYGAWQDWSGFGLVMLAHDHQWDLYDSAWHHFIAGGDLTGGQPEATGTMRGAAVAQIGTAWFSDFDIVADGTVEMTVRLGATPSFDISIGDWKGYNLKDHGEIGLPTAVSIRDFEMRDIPIGTDGTFYKGENIRRDKAGEIVQRDRDGYYNGAVSAQRGGVTGAFYGPGGSEAAGVFYTHYFDYEADSNEGVRGAFGVRKKGG